MKTTLNQFGERLRVCRMQHHLSQEQLARRIGASATSIHKWESGNHLPNLKMFARLVDALDVPMEQLLLL